MDANTIQNKIVRQALEARQIADVKFMAISNR